MGQYAEYEVEHEMFDNDWSDKQPKKPLGAKEGYNSKGRYDGKFRGHIGVYSWLDNQTLYLYYL
jgi:hypothetical protein